jgi:hypothetical protein
MHIFLFEFIMRKESRGVAADFDLISVAQDLARIQDNYCTSKQTVNQITSKVSEKHTKLVVKPA